MSATVTIPIAGFKDVYEVPAVEKALQGPAAFRQRGVAPRSTKRCCASVGQRFTVKPSALPEMDALFEELPNFTEVLEDIRKHLALCVGSSDSVEAAAHAAARRAGPFGKTHFARPSSRSSSAPASASCR